MVKKHNNNEDEKSLCSWRHVILARAHVASTSTENTFSVDKRLSKQTSTHLTKCHKILIQVVAL